MIGVKHTVECQCVLPQYKNHSSPTFHKFVVFSILENDKVLEDFAQCNNCGIVHKIVDICKSEILIGKEELRSVISISDLKLSLPSDLSSVLESYDCDLPNWQHAHFIYSHEIWGDKIVLIRETLDNAIQGKLLIIEGSKKFKIESFMESLELA